MIFLGAATVLALISFFLHLFFYPKYVHLTLVSSRFFEIVIFNSENGVSNEML